MTRRYKTLQKKLKELEAELHYVFSSLPPEENDDNTRYHRLLSQDIQQRFMFVKNLLTAEIASQQYPSKPRHLRHIAKRLTDLESMFREWEDHRSNSHGDVDNNFGCAASLCSCDDDTRGEDHDGDAYNSNNMGESSSSWVYEEVEDSLNTAEGFVDVKVEQDMAREKAAGGSADDDQLHGATDLVVSLNRKQKGWGGYWGGLITGMIFGTVLMGSIVLRICTTSTPYYLTVEEAFLFPT